MNRIPSMAAAALLGAVVASCGGRLHHGGPVSPDAVRYIDTALAVVRTHALDADTLNWAALRQQTLHRAGGARTSAETHEAVQWLVTRVNRHSRLLLPNLWAEIERAVHEKPPEPTGQLLRNGVAYLALPAFVSSDRALALDYVRSAHRLIGRLAPEATCGWILDLRGNTGGNFSPMLLAAGPLLGEGPAGFSRGGVINISVWGYAGGRGWVDFDTILALGRRDTVAPPQTGRVAVLMGARTASAAEGIVISFRGRPRAASFGASTAGLTTGNKGYRLADGAYMVVTETVLGDRLAREYGGRLQPDYRAGGFWGNNFADPADITATAALEWLIRQGGCDAPGQGQ